MLISKRIYHILFRLTIVICSWLGTSSVVLGQGWETKSFTYTYEDGKLYEGTFQYNIYPNIVNVRNPNHKTFDIEARKLNLAEPSHDIKVVFCYNWIETRKGGLVGKPKGLTLKKNSPLALRTINKAAIRVAEFRLDKETRNYTKNYKERLVIGFRVASSNTMVRNSTGKIMKGKFYNNGARFSVKYTLVVKNSVPNLVKPKPVNSKLPEPTIPKETLCKKYRKYNTLSSWKEYLDQYPKGKCANEAKDFICNKTPFKVIHTMAHRTQKNTYIVGFTGNCDQQPQHKAQRGITYSYNPSQNQMSIEIDTKYISKIDEKFEFWVKKNDGIQKEVLELPDTIWKAMSQPVIIPLAQSFQIDLSKRPLAMVSFRGGIAPYYVHFFSKETGEIIIPIEGNTDTVNLSQKIAKAGLYDIKMIDSSEPPIIEEYKKQKINLSTFGIGKILIYTFIGLIILVGLVFFYRKYVHF